jgi:beta-lactamase superfamily II metal-dependent hydrolase
MRIPRSAFTNIDKFRENWRSEDFRKRLVRAYEQVEEDLNTNSLVVYSGPRDKLPERHFYMLCNPYVCLLHPGHGRWFYRPGCLYLGDYDASEERKWEEMISRNRLSKYIDMVGVIQVPHHGSRHNYNKEIADLDCVFVISAGHNNRYRHPHNSVVDDILLKNRILFIVNEQKQTAVRFNVCQHKK